TIPAPSAEAQDHVEASLRRAQQAIESAARTKIEFLGNISHEIRTPLNGIIGMTGLLIDTPLNDEQLEYTRILKGCTETLLNLINDLLDFSKLESSEVDLQETRFHLTESIAGVLRLFDIHARSKNQEIVSLVEQDVPDLLEGDVSRLKQVLGNLLGNAIKFTLDGGGILLMSSKESSNKEYVTLHFAISDSGIGVPSELRQKIFDPFVQADGSLTREYPGVGLGLSISKRLVELLGGDIWCESIPGVGSTFHFTARFKVIDSAPRSPFGETTPLPFPSNLTALIVQPNRIALEHIEMILKKWNIAARGVADEDEALRHFEGYTGNSYPSVALIDMNLARTNGFELAAELHRRAPSLKIIMLLSTENYYEGLRLVKDLGLAGAILKPITHSNLLDALLSLYHSREESSEGEDSARTLLSRGWLAFDPKTVSPGTVTSPDQR
ncbi:MAG: response regulator, partial [Candidatus Omnitrophica bacterium]|nr:response regulator [Candidatus Omnitrophota bacterium]